MQKESPRTGGFEGRYSHYFAGGFVLRRCRNSTRRYPAAPKREFRSQFPLFPLDGFGSAVPSFQLYPVFGAVSSRVPSGNAMSRFVGFGDKSWDNPQTFFKLRALSFCFCPKGRYRAAFGGSISPKTPVLKLKRLLACKPPAAIASELTRVACAPLAKPQFAGFRHR